MLKNYFQKITLFTILACLSLLALIIVIISHEAEEIKEIVLYRLLIATIVFAGIDIVLKQVLKLKPIWLWVIQILLLLLAIYVWIISE